METQTAVAASGPSAERFEPSATPGSGPWLGGAALVLLVALAYLPALAGGFVYDDLTLVLANPRIASAGAVLRSFAEPHWSFGEPGVDQIGFWRPLTVAALGLARAMGGGGPFAFHLLSLLLHLAATLVCWRLARRLLGDRGLAFLAALVFGLHPVHVESVAWISAVNDPLHALFALLSLDAFVAWRQRGSPGVPWAPALWLLPALLAKEQALAVPLMAAVLDLGLWLKQRGERRPILHAYAPFMGALALYVVARMAVFASPLAGFDRAAADFGLTAARSAGLRVEIFGGFLALLAWPADLAVFRMVRPERPSPDPAFLVAVGMLLLWGAGVWSAWSRRAGRVLACLLLLPASFILVLVKFESAGAFPISDRYLYLAVFGWAVLLAILAARFLPRAAALATLAAIAVPLGLKTWDQTAIYRNEETFFRAAVEASPRNPYVRWGMGRVLLDQYRVVLEKPVLDEAYFHFVTSLALGTDYGEDAPEIGLVPGPEANYGLLNVELSAMLNGPPEGRRPDPTVMWSRDDRLQANLGQGYCYLYLAAIGPEADLDAPLIVFQQTAQIWPRSYRAHTALGTAHHAKGAQAIRVGDEQAAALHFQRAKDAYGLAIALNGVYPEAWFNLGQTLAALADWDAARAAFERSLSLRPGALEDRLEVAKTAIEAGRFDMAERHLRAAMREHPESRRAHYWMGMLGAHRRNWPAALGWFDQVIVAQPRHPDAHLQKGKMLVQMGKAVEAVDALQVACEVAPTSFDAHYQVAYVLRELRGDPDLAHRYLEKAYLLSPPGQSRLLVHSLLAEGTTSPDEALKHAREISRRGDYALALDWTDRALRLELWPDDPQRAARMAMLYWQRSRYLTALAKVKVAGESQPLAQARQSRLLAQAREACLRALEFVPDHFWANHDVALLLRELGEAPEVYRPFARRALADLPNQRNIARDVRAAVEQTLRALAGGGAGEEGDALQDAPSKAPGSPPK